VLVAHTTARLIALIDTYLNSTRLDLGSFELNPKLTDLRKEVEELVAVMTPLAALKHLTVKLDMAKNFPQVIVDGNIVSNIIFNLLDNGIAYTDRGSINVHIMLDDHTLRIEVRDTGVGMRPEEAGKLFQKFQRGVMGEERRHKGTGLGLFLVKRLVETAGGTVEAESAGPGKGSTFTARVPVSFKAVR
jgi:signal transduction histidine kinase